MQQHLPRGEHDIPASSLCVQVESVPDDMQEDRLSSNPEQSTAERKIGPVPGPKLVASAS